MNYFWTDLDNYLNLYTSALDRECSCRASTKDGQYCITLDMPGFKKSDLKLTVKNRVLMVTAKNDKRSFNKSCQLPYEDGELVDPEASLEDGVLTVCFKLAKAGETTIQVR